MIQHHASVVVLLSGSHEPFELNPVWSDTLINVRTLRVGPLEDKEARELITAPVSDFPLKYDPEAVGRILTASGRQPYLIQATCRDLVDRLNEEQRLYAGVAEVERAFESCLQTAQVYFVELWKSADTDDTQRKIMIALAQAGGMLPEAELAHKVKETSLAQALRRLERRDIIEKTDDGYRFRADLVRRWVLQNAML
jgi:DNA-binding MarR family transcriptional regulator